MLQYLSIKNSIHIFLFLLFFITTISYGSSEPTLTIINKNKQTQFTRSQLLNSLKTEDIFMSNNRAYPGIPMTYTSVKLNDLLKPFSIKSTDILEFIADDGFYVLIPASKVMASHADSSVGYLAIEPIKQWPVLNNGTNKTAGPFDVIWVNPEKSYISNEYWAWSVIKIVVHENLNSADLIAKPNVNNKNILKGYDIYVSHCAGCHSMNHIGKAVISVDLNIPKNPLEFYPNEAVLKQFIRDPQSVRTIKNARMSGSGKDFLSDQDLDDLVEYFRYMLKHKT